MKRKIILTGVIRCLDEFLVIQRSKNDDFLPCAWEFPGGNIEDGELILEALQREIFEEIGLKINTDKVSIIHFFDKIKGKEEKYHYIELDFLIDVRTKDLPIKLSDEHEDYKWIKKDSNLIDDFIKNKIEKL